MKNFRAIDMPGAKTASSGPVNDEPPVVVVPEAPEAPEAPEVPEVVEDDEDAAGEPADGEDVNDGDADLA
jgi:hypothetical protein